MNFLRKGLGTFGIKLDEDTANMVANFASGGLSLALDHITKSVNPNPPKILPPIDPNRANSIKVVCC